MPEPRVQRLAYEVTAAAPAGVLYGLIADTTQWPLYLPPAVHVEQLEFDGVRERLRMFACAQGRITSWTSVRTLDPARRRVDFRQEAPTAPLAAMGGTWTVWPLDAAHCRVRLVHDLELNGPAPWVEQATEANSRAQLASLARLAERWGRLDEAVLTFEDTVRVHGPAELVYDFLYRVRDWPQLLPQVGRVQVREQTPGVQQVQVLTRDQAAGRAPGDWHGAVRSVRICFPHAGRIVHKQTSALPLVESHVGEWVLEPDEHGVLARARHSVVLGEDHLERELGPGADLAAARAAVRAALGKDSTTVLDLAKQYAESAVPVVWPR